MAGVRDPQFWRRFSMAVHLDEEKGTISDTNSTSTASSKRPPLKQSDTWLEKNRRKGRNTFICGWVIAISLLLVIAGVVMVLMWFSKVGPFKPASTSSTTTSTSTSTTT